MKELLERWNELEPGWCEVKTNDSYLVGKIAVDGDAVGYRVYPPFTEHISLMRIQYAVQQAIAARGWLLKLFHPMMVERWEAQVSWGYFERQESFADADNPAEALLAAYVQALAGLRVDPSIQLRAGEGE